MALNQATKYGLFFVGGIAVGALGMALVSRGKLNIKPLATDLLASGIDLRDKALAAAPHQSVKTENGADPAAVYGTAEKAAGKERSSGKEGSCSGCRRLLIFSAAALHFGLIGL